MKILEVLMNLKYEERRGWKRILPGLTVESVASHSFSTAFIAMLLAMKKKANVEKVVCMALLHDIAEGVIGDITPEMTDFIEKEETESKVMEYILRDLPDDIRDKLLALWREYIEGRSEEAKIVAEADKIDMHLQAKRYEKIADTSEFQNYHLYRKFLEEMEG